MQQPESKASAKLIIESVERVLEEGRLAALVTLIEAPTGVGAKLLVEGSAKRIGSLGDSQLDEVAAVHVAKFLESREEARTFDLKELAADLSRWHGARLLFERIQPELRLVICGAGHVGASLARLASFIGYRATIIDDRAEFVTRDRFPDERIELIAADSWAEAVRKVTGNGHGVAVAVVTRGHNEDEECMRALVTINPDYVGLIGSKRRTSIVIDRLRNSGASDEQLKDIRAPIGLDIGAVTPEEVALAILAEIVAERRGGKGGPLSIWRREKEA
jgi:xanthine dehydrogenase accessory factor